MKLLVVNPGSTSTKIGVFEDADPIFKKTLRHETETLKEFGSLANQYEFRKHLVEECMQEAGIKTEELDAVVGMGGFLKPVHSGTYIINRQMLIELSTAVYGEHASNLGALIANDIAQSVNKPAFVVDPVVVDELSDISRISGHPLLSRRSAFHALNQKAIARHYCNDNGKDYRNINLIVVHMGGGISVGVHEKGKVIDVNNALDGDGPFTPERSGTLPAGDLVALCFSGKYTQQEIKTMIKGNGGMNAYLNSNSIADIIEKAENNSYAKLLINAMTYQIAKEIASVSVAVNGDIDAILLTGGISYNDYICEEITKRVSFIAQVKRYPGEDELSALALGALRVLKGEEEAKVYY